MPPTYCNRNTGQLRKWLLSWELPYSHLVSWFCLSAGGRQLPISPFLLVSQLVPVAWNQRSPGPHNFESLSLSFCNSRLEKWYLPVRVGADGKRGHRKELNPRLGTWETWNAWRFGSWWTFVMMLVATWGGAASVADSLEDPQKKKNRITIWSVSPIPGHVFGENHGFKR